MKRASKRTSPFARCVSHAERFQREYIEQCQARGHELNLDGPAPHNPPRAARRGRDSIAAVLAKLAATQRRIGPRLYRS